MASLSPEQRKQRLENGIKVTGLIIGGFIVAPYVYVAIQGLIGLCIAAGVGISIVFFTPVVASMMGNLRLKMLKSEARRSPVETLQRDYVRKQSALAEFRKSIITFSSEVKNFSDKLVGFCKQYPEDAKKFEDQLTTMKRLLKLRQKNYNQAQDSLESYQLEIQKAGAIWDMGQAAIKMNEAAGMSDDDFYAKIQSETAIDSIQSSMNQAFAELEISLLDDDKETAKQLYAEKQKQLTSSSSSDTLILNSDGMAHIKVATLAK